MARELPDDWCRCKDGGRCHFHARAKLECTCGWPVWVDVDRPPLLVVCRRCDGSEKP